MIKQRKSQAALEFLTTYAWAFLVILIMIGALAYFGVLNPSKILPPRCNFGSELTCLDYTIDEGPAANDGSVRIRMKNGVGEPMTILSELDILTSAESTTPFTCTTAPEILFGSAIIPFGVNGVVIPNGQVFEITMSGCSTGEVGFTEGDKGKLNIDINYFLTKSGPNYARQVRGEIFTTVT